MTTQMVNQINGRLLLCCCVAFWLFISCQQKKQDAKQQQMVPTEKTTAMKTIQGTIVRDSKPIMDATVVIVNGTQPFPEIGALTDTRGQFSFSLSPGQYKFKVFWDDKSKEFDYTVLDSQKNDIPLIVRIDE
jgi:uncharacterized GH25 family protein